MQHFVVHGSEDEPQFEAGPGSALSDSMNDLAAWRMPIVRAATETRAPGQPLSFKIAGTGMLAANTAPGREFNGGGNMGGRLVRRRRQETHCIGV